MAFRDKREGSWRLLSSSFSGKGGGNYLLGSHRLFTA
jgi:hypothetical protein